MTQPITLREAYEKGRRSQATQSDWDDAEARFSNRYCTHRQDQAMCALEHSWCDGWDDAQNCNRDRQPSKDATERIPR